MYKSPFEFRLQASKNQINSGSSQSDFPPQTEERTVTDRCDGASTPPAAYPIVICAVDVAGHAEVSNLDHQALPHQTVAGCQVPVDKVQGCQVDHARGDLGGDVQHLRQSELTQRGHLGLLQDTSIGAVSAKRDRGHTKEFCYFILNSFSCSLSDLLSVCIQVFLLYLTADEEDER